jgi:PilZ domain-containing protein
MRGQAVIKDKRKSDRQRLFLRGFVRMPHNNATTDCIVRDVSPTGAKLRFRCPPQITELFELHVPAKGQIVQSKVIWIDDCEVGISFDSLASFDAPSGSTDELSVRMARLESEITGLKRVLKRLQKLVDPKAA